MMEGLPTNQSEELAADSSQQKILEVPYISQEGILPTGCELISTAMVLQYYGCNVTVDQVVTKTPQSGLTQSINGLVGKHPSETFIGSPRSPYGLGCYAPVVASVMNSFFAGNGVKRAVDVTGTELDTLVYHYIEQNIPVIMWATVNMKEPCSGRSWTIADTGDTFHWITGEHCLVLVGYDSDHYYFNDPYESNGVIPFEKELVRERFRTLGQQAVVVTDAAL